MVVSSVDAPLTDVDVGGGGMNGVVPTVPICVLGCSPVVELVLNAGGGGVEPDEPDAVCPVNICLHSSGCSRHAASFACMSFA